MRVAPLERHFVFAFDANQGLIRLNRTAQGFVDVAEAEQQHQALCVWLDQIGRHGRRLLMDLRLAPGRNDPEFEAMMRRIRPKIWSHFTRVGVLVASQVGALHVSRHVREDGFDAMVSTDEGRLLAYVLATSSGVSPSRHLLLAESSSTPRRALRHA